MKAQAAEETKIAAKPEPAALALARVSKIQFGCHPLGSIECSHMGSHTQRSDDSVSS